MEEFRSKFIRNSILAGILVLLPLAAGLYLMPRMPEQVAIHFDLAGNPNSFMSKQAAVWLLPCIILVVFVICAFVLYMSAKTVKTDEERNMLRRFLWLFPVISIGTSAMFLSFAIGLKVSITLCVVILLVVVFAIILLSMIPVLKLKKK